MIPLPSGYALIAKIGAVALLIGLAYVRGQSDGKIAEQADLERLRADSYKKSVEVLESHAKEVQRITLEQNANNVQVTNEHEAALSAIAKKYNADIATVRANGGLRLPRSVCTSSITAITETTGTSGHYEDVAGTVQLPDAITVDLFSEAKRADEMTEQLRAAQAWIIKNGFYNVPQK